MIPEDRAWQEPFYGCEICGHATNHANVPHSRALGCSCTREVRDPQCPMVRPS